MATFTVRIVRVVGIVICLIAILSFLLFALDQTSTASGHQQAELSGATVAQTHESGFRTQRRRSLGTDELARSPGSARANGASARCGCCSR